MQEDRGSVRSLSSEVDEFAINDSNLLFLEKFAVELKLVETVSTVASNARNTVQVLFLHVADASRIRLALSSESVAVGLHLGVACACIR